MPRSPEPFRWKLPGATPPRATAARVGDPGCCVACTRCCRVVPAELAVTYEEPESAEPVKTGPPLPRTGCLPGALRRCCASAPVASPRFGFLPARNAQDINARVRRNLPEDGLALNTKLSLSCEEIVTIRDLLWMFLEIPGQICRWGTQLHENGCRWCPISEAILAAR
jgi:hypothetical protein